MLGRLACLAVLLLLGQQVLAQTQTNAPVYCNNATSITNFTLSDLSGVWYEVARNPATLISVLCTQVNITSMPNNIMNIQTTYSNSPSYPWVNVTETANVTSTISQYGFNVTYYLYNTPSQTTLTFKVLALNPSTNAYICGYSNGSDPSTFFDVILSRQRILNSTTLTAYENGGPPNFVGFGSSVMTPISQTQSCYANGATSTVSFMGVVLALLYAMFHLVQ
ncbi:uncharacterized protein LOC119682701 [Teleopsis dalmanni]|uniref:uncharacterized protein LOC119682701 n=1 Tax=Teleopsis dalmanni TaxID=139649 RepID=UPI0018CD2D39|nr:uncharacterized protein LOC119682701 [Teleopsis dalmanni]